MYRCSYVDMYYYSSYYRYYHCHCCYYYYDNDDDNDDDDDDKSPNFRFHFSRYKLSSNFVKVCRA